MRPSGVRQGLRILHYGSILRILSRTLQARASKALFEREWVRQGLRIPPGWQHTTPGAQATGEEPVVPASFSLLRGKRRQLQLLC